MTQPEVLLWGWKQRLWSGKEPRVCKFLLSSQTDLNSGLGCQLILRVTSEGYLTSLNIISYHCVLNKGTLRQESSERLSRIKMCLVPCSEFDYDLNHFATCLTKILN